MIADIEIVLTLAAAFFGYLSWKRIAMGSTFEREEVIRNRLKDSARVTDYYQYQLGSVQVSELGGWGYEIWKYLPLIGGIKGNTVVYLYFAPPNSEDEMALPPTGEIIEHPLVNEKPISSIDWKREVSNISGSYRNLEILLNTVNPDQIQKSITDLSGAMMDINSSEED